MAVADGLAHRAEAAYAADVAMACVGAGLERPFDEIFAACDARLRDTRGVALAIAVVDIDSGRMTLASVGTNRAVLLTADKDTHFGRTSGIVGGRYDRLKPETMTLSPGDVLALFSDGLEEFCGLRETLEGVALSSTDQARTVLDRWARVGDDAAVLIYRHDET